MKPEPAPFDDTQEDRERNGSRARGAEFPYLFVALEADRPLSHGARLCLAELDEVIVARGQPGVRAGESGTRSAVLQLPGKAVSSRHARFRRTKDGWVLDDAGSTNGTYVNGARVERAVLASDDVVEIGRTFLLLRPHEASPGQESAYVSGGSQVNEPPGLATLLPGTSRRLNALRQVAASPLSVVLHGETGTGKELLARAVHALSGRRGAFVAVNCATLTDSLGPAQLFGHVRGAFSGAISDAPGFVSAADGGTLLLDEVLELTPTIQAALLRVLQEHEVVPVGGVRPHKVDVRVIATSPLPLEDAVKQGSLRADLFARLSGFTHALEPLRSRREDLGSLIATLLRKHGVVETQNPRFAPELAERLLGHEWPLNVRELEQLLRRAWLFAQEGLMVTGDVFSGDRSRPPAEDAPRRKLSSAELALHEKLVAELRSAGGNVALVARRLGRAPVQIRRWARRLGIDLEHFRNADDEAQET